ncbi:hypothetical protein CLAIMM_06801 [Cladophialophora immunda]|nr:hypothetical protein CLAIMM_06801 [Cladophialophora immunda]
MDTDTQRPHGQETVVYDQLARSELEESQIVEAKTPLDIAFDGEDQGQAAPQNSSVAVSDLRPHNAHDPFDDVFSSTEAFESLSQDPVAISLFDVEQPSLPQVELQEKETEPHEISSSMDVSEMALFTSQPNIFGPRVSLDLPFDITQMGYRRFKDMQDSGPILRDEHGNQVRTTNSPFSDHLSLVEHLLGQKWQKLAPCRDREPRSLQNAVSFMISTFTCLSWQTMTTFLAHTQAHKSVVHVTSWHLNPDPQIYSKIDPWYRATQIQLSVPHPVVIDWVPFPPLRDRLIIFHSSNPRLDEIICEIADCYAAEVDLSKLVVGANPCLAFLRVFDTITAISNDESTNSAPNEPNDTTLPAPSIAALFSNKHLALQTFHLLRMDRGQGLLKLDPTFFERHPELYDNRAELLIARGIAIRPPLSAGARAMTPIPKALDPKTLTKYIEMAKWAYDLSISDDGIKV